MANGEKPKTPSYDAFKSAWAGSQNLYKAIIDGKIENDRQVYLESQKIFNNLVQPGNPGTLENFTKYSSLQLQEATQKFYSNPDIIKATGELSRAFQANLSDKIEGPNLIYVAKEIGVNPDPKLLGRSYRDAIINHIITEAQEKAKK